MPRAREVRVRQNLRMQGVSGGVRDGRSRGQVSELRGEEVYGTTVPEMWVDEARRGDGGMGGKVAESGAGSAVRGKEQLRNWRAYVGRVSGNAGVGE